MIFLFIEPFSLLSTHCEPFIIVISKKKMKRKELKTKIKQQKTIIIISNNAGRVSAMAFVCVSLEPAISKAEKQNNGF